MNYLNLEEVKQKITSLSKSNEDLYLLDNAFDPIMVSNFKIIISDSYQDVTQYETFCLYVEEYFEKTSQFGLIKINSDPRFSYFEWKKYFLYSLTYNKNKESYIGEGVPLDELCQIVKDIYKVSKLRTFF